MRFSSFFAIGFLGLTLIFPFFIMTILYVLQSRLKRPEYVQRLGSVYDGLKTESKMALLYNVLFLSRRLMFSYIVVFVDYPVLQIQMLFYQSILMIMYLMYFRPFELNELNNIEIFNELTILISAYHMLLFTPWEANIDTQFLVGYSMIGVTATNIIVNTGIMFIKTIGKVKRTYRMVKQKILAFMANRASKAR